MAFGFAAAGLSFRAWATLCLSASMRSTTGASLAGSGATISLPSSLASSMARRSFRYSFWYSSGSKSPTRLSTSCLSHVELRALDVDLAHGGVDLLTSTHVFGVIEGLERERVAERANEAEVLLAPEHELADRGHLRVLHGPQKEDVRTPLRLGVGRREVVGAVEVDGVDLLDRDEAEDVDRLRALERDRLEVGFLDHDELALGELPALDELVGLDIALVERAIALLLDRRSALAVEGAEGRVLALLGDRQPDRDVDEAEVDGSVPDSAHRCQSLAEGPPTFSAPRRNPPSRSTVKPQAGEQGVATLFSRTKERVVRLRLRNEPGATSKLRRAVDRVARANGLAADATFDLKLAATEALTNAVKGAPEDHVVDVAIEGGHGAVDVEVTNSGRFRPEFGVESELEAKPSAGAASL